MFGIELPTNLISECESSGGYGYLHNNAGKPSFSSALDPEKAVGIIHIDKASTLEVSDTIRQEMNTYNLPYTIIGKTKNHSKSYFPDRYFERVDYENRVFVYGVLDCYTLIRDWYRNNHDVWIPANIDRAFGWWYSGRNLYVDMYEEYGFVQVYEKIKIGDVLLFKFDNGMPSHSAIYVGQGNMLHHMIGRFSCVEPFDGIYKTSLAGVLRYGHVE